MKQLSLDLPLPEGWKYILRASFTTTTGWKVFAKNYGLKAFRIPVKIKSDPKQEPDSK
ncbi:MAG: hypothetical protein KIT13_12055 [Burkholderiales bacterium]|nr:hypothetical protein [Burkholderiales bacterium]MCW5576819.1 hypothetical protein [Burkholderiales bacterium]MCW5603928.1 hypothetical protein [Burkholderiales bacterium]